MCTMIATAVGITATARRGDEWVPVDEATLGYDHATRLWVEHAVRLDLMSAGSSAVAVELDLGSARALLRRLEEVVREAEQAGV